HTPLFRCVKWYYGRAGKGRLLLCPGTAAIMTKPTVNICWLRRDIRLRDNHALYRALEAGRPVLLVFIFDKNILSKLSDPKDKRLTFIHQSLTRLNEELQRHQSALYCVYDTPLHAFQVLLNRFAVKEVFANHDYEPYALARDSEVKDLLHDNQVPFYTYKDQVIFEKSEIMKPDRSPFVVFTPYSNRWKQLYRETAGSYFP